MPNNFLLRSTSLIVELIVSFAISAKFDNFELTDNNFRVNKNEIEKLASQIDPQLKEAFDIAIERIKSFHKKQKLEANESLAQK